MRDKTKAAVRILSLDTINLERILVVSFVVCLTLVIIAQFVMINPAARVFLTQEEAAEGVLFSKNDTLYESGIMILELTDAEEMRNVWVLVNGQKVTQFNQKQVNISVKDGDLIEIDGTNEGSPFGVKVSSYDSNIKLDIDNSGMTINKNIGVLARVKVK